MARPSEFLPPLTQLRTLPIDDVAARLMAFFAAEGPGQWMHARHIVMWSVWAPSSGEPDLSEGNPAAFLAIIADAWAWLVSRALVVPRPEQDLGWYQLSHRGVQLAGEESSVALAHLRAAARLDVDLHPLIASRVRTQFLLGEYELAAFAAMREVEIRVRQRAGYAETDIGVKFMQQAFGDGGALRQTQLDAGEAQATMALFWDAIGVFKNPSSHRQVDFNDPTLAAEVVLFADLLLRMLDAIAP
jgi:uncharacterized protein (TIGR02391 family)